MDFAPALILVVLAAAASAAPPDCSKMACPKVCECTENKCADQVSACLADETCASLQGCVQSCKCGDHVCTFGCAMKHPTTKVMPLFQCTKSNCWSDSDLPAPTMVSAPHAAPDCSKMACPEVCECTENKCADQVSACLADKTCASLQGCVQDCKCGDHVCTLGCAMKHPTTKVMPLFQCTKSNCWSGDEKPAQSNLFAHQAAPDCSKMACPEVCECTENKCADQVSACLADETCASLQNCVQNCKCGDHSCTLGCAMKHPTTKVMPLFQCTKSNCWSDSDMPALVQAMGIVNNRSGVMPNSFASHAAPDCSKMACPEVCECTENKCADQVSACLADETCASLQGCVQDCKCGDHVCTLGCAMKHPTTKVMPLFQCTKSNCWSDSDMPAPTMVSAPHAAPDCSKMACPEVCECNENKCADQVSACLADETCASLHGCVQDCKCGDHWCTFGCAMKHPTIKVMPLIQCTNSNCWSESAMEVVI